jgi:hypothetical protein
MNKSIKPVALLFVSFFAVTFIFLQSCKKKTPDPDPTPPIPPNYLCDGNATNTYMPLKQGNKWEYDSQIGLDNTREVTGTKTLGGKTYFEVTYIDQTATIKYYYRTDVNGDVFYYYEQDLAEYRFIPLNPTIGQVVATYVSGRYFKVESIDATYNSGSCSYTGLLKINEFDASNTLAVTYYYKKGLGMVNRHSLGYNKLSVVTLK